jgi:hypothetical protein
MRLGTVLHIEDADTQPVAMELASRSGPGSADDLTPGEIVVAATVRIGFALTRE